MVDQLESYLVEMMDSLKDYARENCLVAGMAVLKDSRLDTMLENRKDYLMGHYQVGKLVYLMALLMVGSMEYLTVSQMVDERVEMWVVQMDTAQVEQRVVSMVKMKIVNWVVNWVVEKDKKKVEPMVEQGKQKAALQDDQQD